MINVIIPSYKRSHDLKGKDYFVMAKYCVPESQKHEYIEILGIDRVITIPDDEDGNIVNKRNWILKNIPRPLIMIDDDVKEICYFQSKENIPIKYTLSKKLLNEFFENSFGLCKELNCKMWGINQNTDPLAYKQYSPFNLSKIILGPFQGHLEHDLTFDIQMGTKDDYDMALQHLRTYKKVLRLNKFSYECEHGDNKGGIVSYRSKDKEIEYCKRIMLKWGKKIISYQLPPRKMTDLLNAKKVNIPIKGI
jgi:hypothetical protein